MKDLWLITDGGYDGSMRCIPIFAESEEDVANYIRDNVESDEIFRLFESLYFCNTHYGSVRERLDKWYKKDRLLDLIEDEDEKKKFIASIKKVLDRMSDRELVQGLWGYVKDHEGSYITIKHISSDKFIGLD